MHSYTLVVPQDVSVPDLMIDALVLFDLARKDSRSPPTIMHPLHSVEPMYSGNASYFYIIVSQARIPLGNLVAKV